LTQEVRARAPETSSEATSQAFVDALEKKGFDFYTGVPCSLLDGLIRETERRGRYIAAVREDTAVGLAAGAFFAGKHPVLLMQNSGLGYCLNALTSLNLIYQIPALMLVSWRGFEGKDAPEHLIMGDIHPRLFELAGIPNQPLGAESEWSAQLDWAVRTIEDRRIPVALTIKKGPFHRHE
jgi:sulfopyruvate decarboxylase alpha subunit